MYIKFTYVHFSQIPRRQFSDNNEHALQFIKEAEENLSLASTRPFVGKSPHVHLFLISPLYAGTIARFTSQALRYRDRTPRKVWASEDKPTTILQTTTINYDDWTLLHKRNK